MSATKDYIRKQLYYGKDLNYSHMLMVCDTFDYDDFSVFVPRDENIELYITRYQNPNSMSKIMEIYSYDMDLEYQLNEMCAWHITSKKCLKPKSIAEEAEEFATKKHSGQKRKNGLDYISHPISVAQILERFKKSHNIERLKAAAYLHDLLEDTDTTYYELVDNFGADIASLVMELTTNEEMKNAIGKEKYLAYKLNSMTSWGLVIKLCDRLDNISDLEDLDLSFREKYLRETVFIIDYICQNRKLSLTHRNIITSIVNVLKKFDNNLKLRFIK